MHHAKAFHLNNDLLLMSMRKEHPSMGQDQWDLMLPEKQ